MKLKLFYCNKQGIISKDVKNLEHIFVSSFHTKVMCDIGKVSYTSQSNSYRIMPSLKMVCFSSPSFELTLL